jgi:hypothetical protein
MPLTSDFTAVIRTLLNNPEGTMPRYLGGSLSQTSVADCWPGLLALILFPIAAAGCAIAHTFLDTGDDFVVGRRLHIEKEIP